jgi:aryl-alcohol dehydrogenase-like predicted oxidoreductase
MLPTSKLILGTVQFGIPYGINNKIGKPSREEVRLILDEAYTAGIKTLDTASAYGDAIDVIGQYHQLVDRRFAIINKLQAKGNCEDVCEAIQGELEKLHIQSFEAYLFHSYADYVSKPNVVEHLREQKKKERISKIGVSIYTNEEFEFLLNENKVDLIQLPFNLLDNTNIRGELMQKAKAQGIILHTRSVFLQGLFFKSPDSLPVFLQPLRGYLEQLHVIAAEESSSMAALAIGYALHQEAINGVLIGVDTVEQLRKNLQYAQQPLTATAIEKIENIVVTEKELLNPVNWK